MASGESGGQPGGGSRSSWDQYQRLVMSMLDDNRAKIESLQKELADVRRDDIGGLRTDLALLKLKMSMIVIGVTIATNIGVQLVIHFFKGKL